MDKKILTVKDIMEIYGLKRSYVYKILKIENNPALIAGGPASNWQSNKYLVNAEKFDEWFMNGMKNPRKKKRKRGFK